jgi:diguanylate cyclase (GGDEF)-like protein
MAEDKRHTEDGLYRRLLEKGTPAEEIDQVYRKLRNKGYGEEAARARVEREMRRIRDRNRLEERRKVARGAPEGERRAQTGEARSGSPQAGGRERSDTTRGEPQKRRSQDWFPVVSSEFRRMVNRWAFRNKLLAVGLRERVSDLLSVFRPSIPDYVNPRLVRFLARPSQATSGNPYEYSLRETLEALRTAAGTFLARPGNEEAARAIHDALRRRDPLAAAFLETFFDVSKETRTALKYLELNQQRGRRITVPELARVAREVYRITLRTERVPPGKVTDMLALARDVALAYRGAPAARLDDAEAVLRIAIDNLGRFRRELYPIVLKGIGIFYAPADDSDGKLAALLNFTGLNDEDILDPGTFYEAETRRREREMAERQKRELEWLEVEKAEDFGQRFSGILGVLSVLFPGSGIENLERMPYLLPYFDARVYSQRLPFSHHMQDVEAVAAEDPCQPLLVLHRILDDLLSSIRPQVLERVTHRDGIAQQVRDIGEAWHGVYAELFDRYVRALTNYRKGVDDSMYTRSFRTSGMARSLEEEINQLRNLLIDDYGHTLSRHTHVHAPSLPDLAERLRLVLADIAEDINQDLLSRTDPLGKRMYDELGKDDVVDLGTHAESSAEIRPATRQVKRYLEARYGTNPSRLPRLSQLFFFDVLRGVADMYAYLTNDPNSFLRAAADQVILPADVETRAWKEEAAKPGVAEEERLQIRLSDQLQAEHADGLTGLKNKNFMIEELPKELEALRSSDRPASILMLDIDHFKWINDNLGHQKGDTILQDVGRTLSENSRGSRDRAVRYGGEEFVLFVEAPLHSAVLLAERLRHQQEKRVAESVLYEPVRDVQEKKGGTCGSFSIGVVQASAYRSLDEAVEQADRALYRAKESRNSVALESDSSSHELLSYEEYFRSLQDSESENS